MSRFLFLSSSAKTPNIDNRDIKCDENKDNLSGDWYSGSQSSRERDKHASLHPKLLMKHFYANVLSILYVEGILEIIKEYMDKYITVG